MQQNPQVIVTPLSQNQYLCKLENINTNIKSVHNYAYTELIVIFDISGSMGNTVRLIHELLRKFIQQFNIKNTCIITFCSKGFSTIKNYTDIKKWHCPQSGGTTYLYEGIRQAMNRMEHNNVETLFQLLIISDGELHDLQEVLSYTNKINTTSLNKHVINVTAMRIGKEGDTRALTCFYKFHNHPTCAQLLIDIPHNNHYETECALTQIFTHFKEGETNNSLKVQSSNVNVSKYPFDQYTNVLNLLNGEYFICGDLPNLWIEGYKVIVLEQKIINENDILGYLQTFDMKVRNLKILGNNEILKTSVTFLENIEKCLAKPEIGPEMPRIAQIKLIRKKQNTIINDIKQLINTNNVDKLNSQQQADFLRKIDHDTKSGRRLAARSMENSDDILTTFQTNTTKWLNTPDEVNREADITSFYNLSTNFDIKISLKQELGNEIDILNLEDLLRVVGQVGICFKAHIGNFPDPWQFRVNKVYNVFLAQHDLYEALLIAKKPLTVPGSGSKDDIITGVDVVYDNTNMEYLKNREINKIHCSIAMRSTAVIIPNDDIALKIAVIFKQIDQVMKEPLEISVNNLLLNIKSLQVLAKNPLNICKEEVINGLKLPNMAAYFTGDLDISSINKLLALVFVYNKNDFDMQKFARTLLSLEAYHHIRSKQIENKGQKIIEIFDIKMTHERRRMCNSPGEQEPEDADLKPFYDLYNENDIIAKTNELYPNYDQIVNFMKFLHAYFGVGTDSNNSLLENIKKCQILNFNDIFGIDYNIELLITANVIQALNFPELKYRVDTEKRIVLLPELNNLIVTTEYLKSVIRNEYINDYANQLAAKKQIEKEQATKIEINKLIEEPELDVFIEKLNEYIGQRDSPKYAQLVTEMLTQGFNCIPYLKDKIWIMALCRKPYDDDVIWGRGNVCPKLEMIEFKKMWHLNDMSDITWAEFEKAQDNFSWGGYHGYRENRANRHGHANVCPYGIQYRDVIPDGYWKAKYHNKSYRSDPRSPDDF